MTEFKINDYLTLKLENNETVIYINEKRFIQCKYLLLINPQEIEIQEEINSIDEAGIYLSHKLDREITPRDLGLTPQEEFVGHCSNLENSYDTRLLHSNLAFPLLKKLTEAA